MPIEGEFDDEVDLYFGSTALEATHDLSRRKMVQILELDTKKYAKYKFEN